MTVNELKAMIKLNCGDAIIVTKDDERVEYNGTEVVKVLRGLGDWDGYVQYEIQI
jgi:hypothetical protein